jgi:acetyltransferase-like isoleucine patch superfamily enzyme
MWLGLLLYFYFGGDKLVPDESRTNQQGFFLNLVDYLVSIVVSVLPHAPGANELKCWLMSMRGAKIGQRVKLWSGIWVDRFDGLEIGDDVTIGKDVMFVAGGGVKIGHRTMIGHGSKLISVGHHIPPERKPMRFSGPDLDKVVIANDAWIAAQVVILPGVTVGQGAVIAAGAVVTKDVPSFAIIGGVPAQLIRMRE